MKKHAKECKYQVIATDMLAAGLEYRDRADMLMDYMEALVEMYPECEAVYFPGSGKMFAAEQIRNHEIPRESRFIYFAVNVRFFNIQGTEDMLLVAESKEVDGYETSIYSWFGTDCCQLGKNNHEPEK